MAFIDYFAWFVLIVIVATVVGCWIALATLPGDIARKRKHPQAEAVAVAGWLGAIFFMVFWPIAMVWAFFRPVVRPVEDRAELEARLVRLEKLLERQAGAKK